MIDFSAYINGAQNSGGAPQINGMDLIASIQILLIQDYDTQLSSLSKQIKGATKAKTLYRQEIEGYQRLLATKTYKINGKGQEKKDGKETVKIELESDTLTLFEKKNEYVIDPKTGEAITHTSTLPPDEVIKEIFKKDKGHNQFEFYVEKDAIEKLIEGQKLKQESVNEQSELMSLSLQSLTNQRKIAFEAISNIVSKQHETLSSIVRNLKG